MWFIIKEGENKLEHPQAEVLGHINHQIFPASTRAIPRFLLLCSTTPAHHLPSITPPLRTLRSSPKKHLLSKLLIFFFLLGILGFTSGCPFPALLTVGWEILQAKELTQNAESKSCSSMCEAPSPCHQRCAAVTVRPWHTCPLTRASGRGRTKSPRSDDGNAKRWAASSGPGQLPGTSRLAQRPPNPRPRQQLRIRLRGNAFSTFLSISCPSGLWCWQRRVPCRLGADGCPSPTPAPLRGVGRAGTGLAAPQVTPNLSLVAAGAQDGFGAAQR